MGPIGRRGGDSQEERKKKGEIFAEKKCVSAMWCGLVGHERER